MHIRALIGAGIIIILAAACQDPVAPAQTRNAVPAFAVSAGVTGTGPSNRCYGEILAGIAATWPWAHEGQSTFEPPPGAVALWIEIFGQSAGITSIRELQALFCTD